MPRSRFTLAALAAVSVASLIALVVVPAPGLLDEVAQNAKWAGPAIVLSEITLSLGVAGMLVTAGLAGWRDIVRARRIARSVNWTDFASVVNASRAFWTFWAVSFIGGIGDGVTLIVAIGNALPVAAWGLMLLPFADVLLTIAIRLGIRRALRPALTHQQHL